MKWIGQHIWDLTSRFRGISIFEKAIKLLKSDGGDGGVISMTGNDMVLSNAAGDVLIGSTTYQVGGDQDIFIGDGINSVDLVFEQSGAIKGYDSSVNLTIGGGGGTITFADPVSFVGGGINDEFQFNNLTIDGNFELSPITTSTSGGVLNGGFLNPAAEAKQVHMPQVLNDLAGFNHWGTVTVTGLYKTRTGSPGSYAYSNPVLPSDFASAFDGTSSTAGSWYSDNGASGTVQGEGVITLEWTNEATYGLWFGLVFGSDTFVPSRIKMEAYQTDVGWRTFADLTNVSYTDIGNIILRQIDGNSGTGAATNKLRFTLGHKNSGGYNYFRIHTIYLANYAQGNNNLSGLGTDRTRGYHYLERYRPNYAWGHFYPGQTTTYNLGGSSYRWAIGYFNSLDVAQSLNIAGSISAGSSVGNLNVSAGIGQDLEYGSTAVTTLRFDSDRWRLYAGGTSSEVATMTEGGNFGIGTTSPEAKLDVESEILISGTDPILRMERGDGFNSDIIKVESSTDNIIIGDTSLDEMIFEVDNGEAIRITQDQKVGIGTSSPSNPLTVVGADSVGIDDYILHNDDGNTKFGFPSNDTFKVRTAGSDRFYINSSGNVGIGTTSPSASLHIAADSPVIRLQDNTSSDNHYLTGNNGEFRIQTTGFLTLRPGNTESVRFLANGNVGIGIANPSAKLMVIDVTASSTTQKFHVGRGANAGLYITDDDATAYIKSIQDENAAGYGNLVLMADDDGNKDGYISFNHSDTGEKMRITSSGNVGIGTTSPGKLLDVNGTFRAIGEAFFNGAIDVTSGLNSRFRDGTALNFNTNRTARIFTDSNDLIIQQGENDKDIIFKCDNGAGGVTTYFTLDGSSATHDGSVTTSMYTQWGDNSIISLGYAKDFSMYHTGSKTLLNNNTGNLEIRNSADDSDIIFQCDDGSGGVATYLQLDGSSTRTRAFKDVNFDDSIKATFGASSDLQIFHDGSNSYINDGGTGHLNIKATNLQLLNAAGNKYYASFIDGGYAKLFYNGSEKLATTSTGISVAGLIDKDANSTSTIIRASRTDGTQEGLFRTDGWGNFTFNKAVGIGYDTDGILGTAGVTGLVVSGDVGIGTASPSEKLEVNGKIKATSINFSGLPTSSAGLSSGDVWNDGGTLKIVS